MSQNVNNSLNEYAILNKEWVDICKKTEGREYVFDKETHCLSLLHNLDIMRSKGTFVDTELVATNGKSISFHGILLAASGTTFRDILYNDYISHLEGKLAPRGATVEALDALRTYIYKPDTVLDSKQTHWNQILDFCSTFGVNQIVSAKGDPVSLLDNLNDMNNKSEMCFTVLVSSEGGEYFVNAAVIAASSPVLLDAVAPLHLPPVESRVVLENVNSSSISAILEFIYTGRILITSHNVENLLISSASFKYTSVLVACCDFIKHQINVSNALGVRALVKYASSLKTGYESLITLFEYTEKFIIENISWIIQREEFEKIPTGDEIMHYLLRARLKKTAVKDVVHGSIRWFFHDTVGRLEEFNKIIVCTNMIFSPKTVENIRHRHWQVQQEKEIQLKMMRDSAVSSQ